MHRSPLLNHKHHIWMQGTSTLVLESPFYGARMPKVQTGSRLQRVSDLLTLGRATIEEGLFLLHGTAQRGIKRLGPPQLLVLVVVSSSLTAACEDVTQSSS